ncbi:DNA glycosylase AlkZ-like family protein [Saccharopolyspora sp. ASAGF58]|uniref:DNA glycosylase AlkZ-like family protein n=1 Tax=Saccharopolyspora sp. ASAGF58 TaxID=2719023 RepID=UPI00143FBA25|nr:crosslink repair DNA glycosylase YcaQ family protein [Saccharopolyspora sp. ASAGF58]QIZ35778.1 winged helix DNA-binding domain-containing protein [Saccharopolyspora sp. ASAGF58]
MTVLGLRELNRATPERQRTLRDENGRKRLFSTKNAVLPGTILVDGFRHGTWRLVRRKHTATLLIEPYRKPSEEEADAVAGGPPVAAVRRAERPDHDVRITSVAV